MIVLQESHGCCAVTPVPEQTHGADNFCSIASNHSLRSLALMQATNVLSRFRQWNLLFSQARRVFITLKQSVVLRYYIQLLQLTPYVHLVTSCSFVSVLSCHAQGIVIFQFVIYKHLSRQMSSYEQPQYKYQIV